MNKNDLLKIAREINEGKRKLEINNSISCGYELKSNEYGKKYIDRKNSY